ncbi:MAG: hypothetical protein HYX93_05115 [Chloroflexi bacterium]|nr:hypothetical protein [Chloroflexota bacterium]
MLRTFLSIRHGCLARGPNTIYVAQYSLSRHVPWVRSLGLTLTSEIVQSVGSGFKRHRFTADGITLFPDPLWWEMVVKAPDELFAVFNPPPSAGAPVRLPPGGVYDIKSQLNWGFLSLHREKITVILDESTGTTFIVPK